MTSLFSPISLVAFTAPLLTTATVQAQTLSPEAQGPRNFVASHWETIAIGASLISAGIGAGVLLWKHRGAPPKDGVVRTPSQTQSHRKMIEFEKILAAEKREPRRAALAGLLNIVPSLAPSDRSRAIYRTAQHFCLDWKWLFEDKTVETVLRSKVSRWPTDWRDELTRKLAERLEDPQEAIRKNAAAAHKWFHSR